jgi:pimeloyl-ACP methyl ester carboxylesterase
MAPKVHVCLLHGEMLDSESWGGAFLKALAPFTLTRIDLLGHGTNQRRPVPVSFDKLVQAARARFLVAARPTPEDVVVLVGHSLGAWVAGRWAETFDGVDGIALIGSVAGLDLLQLEQFAGLAMAIEEHAGFSPENARALVTERWMPGLDAAVQQRFIDHLMQRKPAPSLAILRMLMCSEPIDLPDLTTMVRTVRGEHDSLAASHDDDLIVGDTHFPHLEEPVATASHVHTLAQSAIVQRGLAAQLEGHADWFDPFVQDTTYSTPDGPGEPPRLSGDFVRTTVLDGDGHTLMCRVDTTSNGATNTSFQAYSFHNGVIRHVHTTGQ